MTNPSASKEGAGAAQRSPSGHRSKRRLRRTALLLPLMLVGVAALYQSIATAIDAKHHPPPGRLVDVGGHRLHIHCLGEGSPAVILESGADFLSPSWAWVQPSVAQLTRTCAYDRAGMAWSDPGPAPRDAEQIARELHTLLDKAGVPGPYVMVGHSLGGLYARVFTARWPNEVVGLVLIDPAHPDQDAQLTPEQKAAQDSDDRMMKVAPYLARLGIFRLLGLGHEMAKGLPERQREEYNAFYSSAAHWDGLRAVLASRPATYMQGRAAGSLGDRPLIVLSRSEPADGGTQADQQMDASLAHLSSVGVHRVVAGATHGSLLLDEPHAKAVDTAVRQVIEAARAHRSITQ